MTIKKLYISYYLRLIIEKAKQKILQITYRYTILKKNIKYYYSNHIALITKKSFVFFPYYNTTFFCGLCSIISIKNDNNYKKPNLAALLKTTKFIDSRGYSYFAKKQHEINTKYLGGEKLIKDLFKEVRFLKKNNIFLDLFINEKKQKNIRQIVDHLSHTVRREQILLEKRTFNISTSKISLMTDRLEVLEDIHWCLDNELLNNFKKIKDILPKPKNNYINQTILFFKQINTVLSSIDKLEVRGRDSAGISIFFNLTLDVFNKFKTRLKQANLINELIERKSSNLLTNRSINCKKSKNNKNQKIAIITITYKIASEIGNLGDNTNFIRQEIKNDQILCFLITTTPIDYTISSHTRWASVGAITEPNCHPIDNVFHNKNSKIKNIIHVCLNGEIDNYLELKTHYEIQDEITTDTKIIPIKIEEYFNKGIDIVNSFRLAVSNFQGSHAITMHTDLAPGKLLIAQKGSGQAMFVGLSDDFYIATSEVYGFVEETNKFLKINGTKIIKNKDGNDIQGQVFILDQKSKGKIENITAMYYDGTPIKLKKSDIRFTNVTSKDIDRKEFKHFFLKEIYESPTSVKRTLDGKWNIKQSKGRKNYSLNLNEKNIPKSIQKAFKKNLIKYIFFIGQGTAGVAAQTCSDILKYFLVGSHIHINSLRSSEFSGFEPNTQDTKSLNNTLVVAITQSGSTTDTNRSVDIARSRNAYTIAIVNRRDSDITFKVDGVIYTSSGRDIEMSVASTKAFYSQITAGALLCLQISQLTQIRTDKFISNQIEKLLKLPSQMSKVLHTEENIKKSAQKLAPKKRYWATVGSGPNKASADEIRIKLSELCYRTISSDFVEDKKHIDLSSEPLILVCAAGLNRKVIDDIIKEIAIFKAHKATPIVIADEEETRFESYAKEVFYVPKIDQYLAPILNSLVGHIWGYHAALSINKASQILSNFRDNIQKNIDNYTANNFDVFEIVRKKSFRSKINKFYRKLKGKISDTKNPIQITNQTDLILLLKYLSGRIPISDFEIDFGKKGTAIEMLCCFFKTIDQSIKDMSRPIDAIKHQAKTVTVGTSRISNKVDGILFEAAKSCNITISQLTNKNITIMKNLQKIIATVQGSILYTITKLDSLGEPNDSTEIRIKSKSGTLKSRVSRVENDNNLKGAKYIVVSRGDIYVGKGRKDGQNVLIIPARSDIPHESDKIRYLLLLNIAFRKKIPLKTKIKALGGKYDNIKNIVHENSIPWNDKYINSVKIDILFGFSAEKIGEYIVSNQNGRLLHM